MNIITADNFDWSCIFSSWRMDVIWILCVKYTNTTVYWNSWRVFLKVSADVTPTKLTGGIPDAPAKQV